ncbi:MAG: hypothetical protein IKL28_07110 [Lachnospiraceae bacterium]|nr:hypothetical protein [Lachnospiraceae bacterium]
MKEQLYTIPVNEAFTVDCECPVCAMRHKLKEDALDYTLGPSYMEDDIRMVTDKVGFCKEHVQELYNKQNRLGLALMLKTHADKTIRDVSKLVKNYKPAKPSLFKKDTETNPMLTYLDEVQHSCFVCNKINNVFERYIATIFFLYEKESEFRNTVDNCKGFCSEHYALLLREAPKQLSQKYVEDFTKALHKSYIQGMERVRDDLSWFIDKFDYRYTNEPWKNSKDSLQRMMMKQNSLGYFPDEGKK